MSGVRWLAPATALRLLDAAPTLTPERTILRDWLRGRVERFESLAFEVRVGPGRACPCTGDAAAASMWRKLTADRADLVARAGDVTWLVEAKEHARIAAVAQLRRYVLLWQTEYPDPGVVVPVLICRSMSPGVDRAVWIAGGRSVVVDATAA